MLMGELWVNLDRVHRFPSNGRKLDRQSDSEEGYSRVAVEPG